MNIRNILHSGEVVRFHNHVGVDKQKTSEHQWGVALIVQYIHKDCSKSLLLAAMTHDAAEYFTGDVPFPAKQMNRQLNDLLRQMEISWEKDNGVYFELSREDHVVLKMADVLEGLWFCIGQVRIGHINAKRPFRKWRKFFSDSFSAHKQTYPKAFELYSKLIQEMEEL